MSLGDYLDKKPLIVIVGPTASGKTKVSISLAKILRGEIISADSMLIYKHMDIGTAKPSLSERENIPHHLVDILEPQQEFSAAQFQKAAIRAIDGIHERGLLPIMVGGTGLYVNSVIYPMNFTDAGHDPALRASILEDEKKYGTQYLYEQLRNIDPAKADAINPNDTKRIVRALEVHRLTGNPMSFYNQNNYRNESRYRTAVIGLNIDRSKLYQNIDRRVDKMIEDGLIEEVKELKKMGCNSAAQSMQGLGYKQILEYLEGRINLSETIDLIKRNTRRFAKRQLTWFRRDKRIYWINTDDFESSEDIANAIAQYLKIFFASNREGYSI